MRYQSTVQLLMRQWFRLFLSYHVIKLCSEHVPYTPSTGSKGRNMMTLFAKIRIDMCVAPHQWSTDKRPNTAVIESCSA